MVVGFFYHPFFFLFCFYLLGFFALPLTLLCSSKQEGCITQTSLHSLLNKSSHFRQYVNKLILSAASFLKIIYYLSIHRESQFSWFFTWFQCQPFWQLTPVPILVIQIFPSLHTVNLSPYLQIILSFESLWSLHSLLKIIKFHFDLHGVRRV